MERVLYTGTENDSTAATTVLKPVVSNITNDLGLVKPFFKFTALVVA